MRITPKELSQRLAGVAENFCRWILPNGKKEGGEWCVGSLGGEAGKSLKVHLSGAKAGVWCDFASGDDKGDLLDLIAETKSISLSHAIKEVKEWFGIRDFESVVQKKKYIKPDKKNMKGIKPLNGDGPVVVYLKSQRKLLAETIAAYKVAARDREMAFPTYSEDGKELLNVKYIGIDRDENGKKLVHQEKGCAPALFGWNAILASAREVIITEGQIDAMTWHQMGYPALSVPDGVASDAWVEFEWDNLERFDTIYLNFDNDKPGQEAVYKVAKRLGVHRCLSIMFTDHKDANDALQAGYTQTDFSSTLCAAKQFTPQQLKTADDFKDALVKLYYSEGGKPAGFFPKMFHSQIGFRPGELTVWTGVSGHGKSVFLLQMAMEAMAADCRFAIASMEMKGEQTLRRMVNQICAKHLINEPTLEQINNCIEWFAGKLWIYDVMGNVKPDTLFDLMEYSRARHGVNHFVIDSLMKCSVAVDDYESQRVFTDRLATFAKSEDVHVHLVAHARKGRDESDAVGKLDVKGASEIINQADNIMVVWRNKPKEKKMEENQITKDQADQMPDAIMICEKQRENGWEGRFGLWYDPSHFIYMPQDRFTGIKYIPALGPVFSVLTENQKTDNQEQ
jgi:twinkle protein